MFDYNPLPESVGGLTGLHGLDLQGCWGLTSLPESVGALTGLHKLNLEDMTALHTPPPHEIRAGRGAVLQFLRDLGKGESASHLVKVVLLGDQHAGKSSLADSLVLGPPAPRAASDHTVGIDVLAARLRLAVGGEYVR